MSYIILSMNRIFFCNPTSLVWINYNFPVAVLLPFVSSFYSTTTLEGGAARIRPTSHHFYGYLAAWLRYKGELNFLINIWVAFNMCLTWQSTQHPVIVKILHLSGLLGATPGSLQPAQWQTGLSNRSWTRYQWS